MIDENLIAALSKRKIVSNTFRRLDPTKKELVYHTAVRLFGEYGYDGLPVDRFCAEARISKGSFFQYFPSKSHLLEFTLLSFDFELERWMEQIRKQEKAVLARDRLRYAYSVMVVDCELSDDQKRFFQFATHAIMHAGVAVAGVDLERHLREYVSEIVMRGAQTGELRGDIAAETLAFFTQAFYRGMIDRVYVGKKASPEESGENFVSVLFDGVKA
jgi:AcrR family transcriptional regulator